MSMDASGHGAAPGSPETGGAEAEGAAEEAEEARLRAEDESLDLVEQLLEAYFMQVRPPPSNPSLYRAHTPRPTGPPQAVRCPFLWKIRHSVRLMAQSLRHCSSSSSSSSDTLLSRH